MLIVLLMLAGAGTVRAQVFIDLPTAQTTMSFGIVASDKDLSGTVVLSPITQSITSVTGGAIVIGGTVDAPRFRAGRGAGGGNSAQTVTITWPTSFTVSNGSHTATVNNITCHPQAGVAFNCVNGGTISVRRNENAEFYLGGTLNLAADQPQGVYTGTLAVEAN